MRPSEAAAEPPPPGDPGGDSLRSRRGALALFLVVVVVAIPVLRYQNREQWFFFDDFDFLADRALTSTDDLFRPHNEHWSTLPIVVYRLLYRVVGLNHYWPYQAVLIGIHLLGAGLLRALMRRAAVDPWIATALATLFVFLGSGRENIGWSFQIGFTGALVFGLAHQLLADHDGPFDRRDALGVACGLAALMCSGIGVAMAVGVALAVLLRRGWRLAAAHVLPLAAAYGVWYLIAGAGTSSATRPRPDQVARFAGRLVGNAFTQMGGIWPWAVGLALLVVWGLARGGTSRLLAEAQRRDAVAVGLLASAAAVVAVTAVGRSGTELAANPQASRYVYLVAALCLPAIGIATSGLVAGRPVARAAMVVFLLLGLPGNVSDLQPQGVEKVTLGNPSQFEELAATAQDPRFPSGAHPAPFLAPDVTIGWLRQGAASGRIPVAEEVAPLVRADVETAVALQQVDRPPGSACHTVDPAAPFTARRGDLIVIGSGPVTVTRLASGSPDGSASYIGDPQVQLAVRSAPLELQLVPALGTTSLSSVRVCG